MIQDDVQDLLDRAVAAGTETGAQVSVIADGQTVVEATSGHTSADRTSAIAPDTLFFAASAAKAIASTVAHVLVERGLLGYDTLVADVWPELGAHGKDKLTLRHVLLHTAGVPAPPYETTVRDLGDWDHMCASLADAQPWWEPGTQFGYHAVTFGFLLGEIVRRATGHTLPFWLDELITGPLGVSDEVHFGVPPNLLDRVAQQVAEPGVNLPSPVVGSPAERALPPHIRPDATYANRPDVLTADIPSQGTMSARGAARIYAALLGQVPDVQLISADRLAEIATVTIQGRDVIMDVDFAWAFGYSPHRPGGVAGRLGSTIGMVGMNGSVAYADIDSGVAVGVMRNRFNPMDLTLITKVDRLVANAFPPRAEHLSKPLTPTADSATEEHHG